MATTERKTAKNAIFLDPISHFLANDVVQLAQGHDAALQRQDLVYAQFKTFNVLHQIHVQGIRHCWRRCVGCARGVGVSFNQQLFFRHVYHQKAVGVYAAFDVVNVYHQRAICKAAFAAYTRHCRLLA